MPTSAHEVVIGGHYEHYKGQQYRVPGVVRHNETLEQQGETRPRFRYLLE